MLPCCPKTNVANNNAVTKQMTARLTFIWSTTPFRSWADFARPFPLGQAASAFLYNSADGAPMFKRAAIDKMCRRVMSSNVASEERSHLAIEFIDRSICIGCERSEKGGIIDGCMRDILRE